MVGEVGEIFEDAWDYYIDLISEPELTRDSVKNKMRAHARTYYLAQYTNRMRSFIGAYRAAGLVSALAIPNLTIQDLETAIDRLPLSFREGYNNSNINAPMGISFATYADNVWRPAAQTYEIPDQHADHIINWTNMLRADPQYKEIPTENLMQRATTLVLHKHEIDTDRRSVLPSIYTMQRSIGKFKEAAEAPAASQEDKDIYKAIKGFDAKSIIDLFGNDLPDTLATAARWAKSLEGTQYDDIGVLRAALEHKYSLDAARGVKRDDVDLLEMISFLQAAFAQSLINTNTQMGNGLKNAEGLDAMHTHFGDELPEETRMAQAWGKRGVPYFITWYVHKGRRRS